MSRGARAEGGGAALAGLGLGPRASLAGAAFVAALVAGCASQAPLERDALPVRPGAGPAGSSGGGDAEPRRGDAEPRAGGGPPPTAEPSDFAPPGDPYTERPGRQGPDDPAPEPVRFEAPPAQLEPVSLPLRPALALPARVAVVFARDGALVSDAARLLRLDDLVASDEEVAAVVALREPTGPARASLESLAAAADRDRLGLVLVDVRPGERGARRTGYLVHAASGALLARFDVPAATASGDERARDLVARLAVAYARLE